MQSSARQSRTICTVVAASGNFATTTRIARQRWESDQQQYDRAGIPPKLAPRQRPLSAAPRASLAKTSGAGAELLDTMVVFRRARWARRVPRRVDARRTERSKCAFFTQTRCFSLSTHGRVVELAAARRRATIRDMPDAAQSARLARRSSAHRVAAAVSSGDSPHRWK